jgi:hypothetical protein
MHVRVHVFMPLLFLIIVVYIYVIVPFVFFSRSYSNSVLKLTPMYCITLFVNVLHSSINREYNGQI